MTDLDAERVERGVAGVRGEIDDLLPRGRIDADAANRLTALVTGSTSMGAFAEADLVIEAVFEEMAVNRQVFAQVEAVERTCVLGTSTSSLSVAQMATQLQHPSGSSGSTSSTRWR